MRETEDRGSEYKRGESGPWETSPPEKAQRNLSTKTSCSDLNDAWCFFLLVFFCRILPYCLSAKPLKLPKRNQMSLVM